MRLIIRNEKPPRKTCPICREFNDQGPVLKIINLDEDEGGYTHQTCINKTGCYDCGGTIGTFAISVMNTPIHLKSCVRDRCYFCSKIVGDDNNRKLIKNCKEFCHAHCYNSAPCYACGFCNNGLTITGKADLILDVDLVRHENCRPFSCTDCKSMIGRLNSRIVFGNIYHRDCGPKCNICNTSTDYDTHTLILDKESQLYKHKNCTTIPCFVCEEALGSSKKYNTQDSHISYKVHVNCTFQCKSCKKSSVDSDKFLWKGITGMNYRHCANWRSKQEAMGIYGLQKKKFVKRADGSKMYLPNEIAEMIIRLILLEVPINKEYLDNCPTRKGGKDMNNICTSYRCSDATCPYCKAKLGWNKNNYELCNVTSCNKIRTAFQKILKLVFNYQGPETRVKSLWPPTTEIGLRFVNTMLVGCCQDLTEKQLLLYNVLLKSLKIYRRGVNG